ncbi:MAG TPA: Fe-S cluster assembly protein SufD [Azospirillaceae bacterium]|nr:Fe-S cluster assembly protein SufD [Azospirillaceae bacterium]
MTAAPQTSLQTSSQTAPQAATEPFVQQFAAHHGSLPGAALPWLGRRRELGLERFRAKGFPTPRVEEWKYTNLRALERIAFAAPRDGDRAFGVLAADALPTVMPGLETPRLVFVDGRFNKLLSRVDALPAGVRLDSLAGVLATSPDLVEPYLGRLEPDAGEPLVGLNAALAEDGLVLMVEDGVALEMPVEVVYIGTAAERAVAYHPRNLVVVGKGALVTLVEHHLGLAVGPNPGTYFANHVTEVTVGPQATLHHYKVQREGVGAFHVARTLVQLAQDAHYDNFALSSGARLARNEIHARLDGTGIMCRLNGAYMIGGQQHCDTTTFIDHAHPSCGSREVYKGVIDGHGRAVFQGKILVRRDAQKTDGYQLNNALLLSDTAEIDAKPELEIYADDVKCSHGATAGELDEDQLFYLRARGVPKDEARGLLIGAFLAEAVTEVQHEGVRESFGRLVEDWLSAHKEAA